MVFFPVVTAGPITRVQVLVEQLEVRHRFDYGGMQSGLLADRPRVLQEADGRRRPCGLRQHGIRRPVPLFAHRNGLIFTVAAVFFSIQLYCDFSGYTDVVRGSARLFGVELPLNFRAPYFARRGEGLLAAVAHVTDGLAARLRLHPARRQPAGQAAPRPQRDDGLPGVRPVARRGAQLLGVGWAERHLHDRRREDCSRRETRWWTGCE